MMRRRLLNRTVVDSDESHGGGLGHGPDKAEAQDARDLLSQSHIVNTITSA